MYKNIEVYKDQITPPILFEPAHNYHWLIRAGFVDQKEDGKKGCKKHLIFIGYHATKNAGCRFWRDKKQYRSYLLYDHLYDLYELNLEVYLLSLKLWK